MLLNGLFYQIVVITCLNDALKICTQTSYYDVLISSYTGTSEIYIGVGLVTVIVLALVLLCATYVCCKKRILADAAAADLRFSNPRTRRHRNRRHGSSRNHNDVIPSTYLLGLCLTLLLINTIWKRKHVCCVCISIR